MTASGHSLVELLATLAILGLLAGAGAWLARPRLLGAVAGDLRMAVDQAFLVAHARGEPVRVVLAGPGGDLPPLALPGGVAWGLPARGLPLPPGMVQPVRAHRTGAAHPAVAVTPAGAATASAWFLHDGRDALCLRLSGQGGVSLLRWREARRRWEAF